MANDINIVVSADARSATQNLQKAQNAVNDLDRRIKRSTGSLNRNANAYNKNAVATNKWAKGALQQAGYQVGDFFVQVGGGTNALQAFGQQGAQLAGIFGPMGAVVGAGIAIFSAVAVAVQKSANGFDTMSGAVDRARDSLKKSREEMKKQRDEIALLSLGLSNITQLELRRGIAVTRTAIAEKQAQIQKTQARFEEAGPRGDAAEEMNKRRQEALKNSKDGLNALKEQSEQLQRQLKFSIAINESMKGPKGIKEKFANTIFDPRAAGFDKALADFARVQLGLLNTSDAFKDVSESAKGAGKSTSKFADQFAARLAILGGPLKELNELQRELEIRQSGGGNLAVRLDEAAEAAKRLAYEAGIIDPIKLDQIGQEASKLESNIAAAEEAIKNMTATAKGKLPELSDEMKKIQSAQEQAANAFGNAFTSVIEGTKSVKDAFKAMASDIINQLFRIFVVQRITGFISGALGGMFGGGAPSVGGGFNSPVAGLTLPSANGGGYTGNGARAGGLDGKGGRMAVIHPRETILDHTKGQGQGVTVVQNINVSAGVAQTVRAEMTTMLPQIGEYAKAAVLDARKRGGAYGGAFA